MPPPLAACVGLTVGKFVETENPATCALPEESTLISLPPSPARAAEVGGVDEGRAGGVELRHEGVRGSG